MVATIEKLSDVINTSQPKFSVGELHLKIVLKCLYGTWQVYMDIAMGENLCTNY